MATTGVRERVERAAEAALQAQGYVSLIEVLMRLQWLPYPHVERWRQGRIECLETMIQAKADKLAAAVRVLDEWTRARGLQPRETAYLARARDHRPLRFSVAGTPEIEQLYRTHWLPATLSPQQQERLTERQSAPPDLVVIAALNPWTCGRCTKTDEDLLLMEDDAPMCLSCVGLGHLVFLPAGDAGLTRRARKLSNQIAVVVRFSRSRQRYERQGLLVEADALQAAGGASPAVDDGSLATVLQFPRARRTK